MARAMTTPSAPAAARTGATVTGRAALRGPAMAVPSMVEASVRAAKAIPRAIWTRTTPDPDGGRARAASKVGGLQQAELGQAEAGRAEDTHRGVHRPEGERVVRGEEAGRADDRPAPGHDHAHDHQEHSGQPDDGHRLDGRHPKGQGAQHESERGNGDVPHRATMARCRRRSSPAMAASRGWPGSHSMTDRPWRRISSRRARRSRVHSRHAS